MCDRNGLAPGEYASIMHKMQKCDVCDAKGHGPSINGECQLVRKRLRCERIQEREMAARDAELEAERARVQEYVRPLLERIVALERLIASKETQGLSTKRSRPRIDNVHGY